MGRAEYPKVIDAWFLATFLVSGVDSYSSLSELSRSETALPASSFDRLLVADP
jgi:hypothetical protein